MLNFSYYDEINLVALNSTNTYNLNITDGTFDYSNTGTFAEGYSHAFCTNLNPAQVVYGWNVYGTVLISDGGDYLNRIYTYPSDDVFSISNNPITYKSLYLITAGNSTTVTYTWSTTEYQDITGTLEVYRCQGDGSQNLVAVVPITNGKAVANIELLAYYSYQVIIDGIRYAQNSFTVCHPESSDAPTYFVDISDVNIETATGLLFVDCKLTEVDNDTVLMTFNDILGTSTLQGCIYLWREDIYNRTLISVNCSTPPATSITYNFPYLGDGNTYYLEGIVNQSGDMGYCNGNVIYNQQGDVGEIYGTAAIISTLFLIVGLLLIWSSTGAALMVAGMISVILSWWIGLLTGIGWMTVTSIVAFLLIVVWVGRGAKK